MLLSFHSWKKTQVFNSVSACILDFLLELCEATRHHTELSIQLIKFQHFAVHYSYTETAARDFFVTCFTFFLTAYSIFKKKRWFVFFFFFTFALH